MDRLKSQCRALLFDVFGTLVDWRSSVTSELAAFFASHTELQKHAKKVDWQAVALDWRARYQPSMDAVRTGERPFVILDVLHRESLAATLEQHQIDGLDDAMLDELALCWHKLDAWPEVPAALQRLRTHYTLAAVSNGNKALLENLAAYANLNWHVSLGAEPARAYKPMPIVYQRSAAMLALEPPQCMMVAAHNDDLAAARALGFQTAYINRPYEYGARQTKDFGPESDWDISVDSLSELADIVLK
ncbi:MAG: haloacid dehalogenase type II [Granulosicoccus sp.]|nr:haloacid dehalogenase type II [Granulosicoccus sp.]